MIKDKKKLKTNEKVRPKKIHKEEMLKLTSTNYMYKKEEYNV